MDEVQPQEGDEPEQRRLLTNYGELVLLLDGPEHALREAFRDCSVDQLRDIIMVYEDQLNDADIEGNEELFKRLLYLRMFAIRQIDRKEGNEENHHYLTYEEERDWQGIGR